ncbi:hypothetical protein F4553_001023 [Allocatelliglobosispora scoriae]|uniref:DUF6458 domain-containing protein n=1 Tax=Allocatelliglobosispora scoriae TaxID=643052 RepID=A0A841BH77_9ACTN|nr:DUF6458 family protein [Allocatelliglobosispora scoriae]MBB5867644.1 hypothetical protein [Allocatelliglobosispora scoriae]
MGIGASVFLLALGAIFTFALDVKVGWLDLDAVGWILMAAGAFGLVFTLMLINRRRSTAVVTRDPATVTHVEERTDIPTELR